MNYNKYKFALLWLWGEAQLCLPYVCLKKKVMSYSDPIDTLRWPNVKLMWTTVALR